MQRYISHVPCVGVVEKFYALFSFVMEGKLNLACKCKMFDLHVILLKTQAIMTLYIGIYIIIEAPIFK